MRRSFRETHYPVLMKGASWTESFGGCCAFLKPWLLACLAVWQEPLEISVHQSDEWHIWLSPRCHDSCHHILRCDIRFICITKKKTTWMFWCILSAFGLIRTPTKIWSLCTSFPESMWRCRVSGVVFSSVCPGPISRRFPPKNKSTGDRCIVFYAWIYGVHINSYYV